MSEIQKTWVAPVVTGAVASILGGVMLVWLISPNKLDVGSNVSAPQTRENTNFPTPSKGEWETLANEASYARNYSRKSKQPNERFEQVITIYETLMGADRRIGKIVAPDEYVQIFKVGQADDVVIQVRVDRGNYWLLSRQRIALPIGSNLISKNPESDDESFQLFHFELQDVIDSTRHFMRTKL